MDDRTKILEILNMLEYDNYPLTLKEYNVLKEDIIELYKSIYNTIINKNTIDKYFALKYVLKNSNDYITPILTIDKNNHITLKHKESQYDTIINTLNIPLEYKEKQEHFIYLQQISNHSQQSKEWFELRNTMLTASVAADVLGESKYGNRTEVLLDKLGLLPNKYKENMFVHHGKKYEQIATMIYENVYNTKIKEFGLIPYYYGNKTDISDNFLGASPDGISSCTTLDGKMNKLLGRLLEIKCPLKRKIINIGNVDSVICPRHYWIQVQVQLACCNSEECDFWQCEIEEINESFWIANNKLMQCYSTEEQGVPLIMHDFLKRGCIIQLLPKNKSKIPKGDNCEWYSKYIYPNNLMMSLQDYMKWKNYMIDNWETLYFNYSNDYYFDKIIYWRLKSCHNVLIKRDKVWFDSKYNIFKDFWNDIILYKNDTALAEKLLKEYINASKKNSLNVFKKQPKSSTQIIDDFLSIS